MNEVYINAKNFKNDDLSIMFGKDIISIEELVDKIYELSDINDEIKDELDSVKDALKWTKHELSLVKNGYIPD